MLVRVFSPVARFYGDPRMFSDRKKKLIQLVSIIGLLCRLWADIAISKSQAERKTRKTFAILGKETGLFSPKTGSQISRCYLIKKD